MVFTVLCGSTCSGASHLGRSENETIVKGLISFQRSPWEAVASVLIALGVLMLMQPFYLVIFTYSFSVILTGTVMYLICSHFKDKTDG